MNEKQSHHGGKAFQSVLTPHFDFIRHLRQQRKSWREIAERLGAEKNVHVCLHTAYYFYKRRLTRAHLPHWEAPANETPPPAPAPARKPILAVIPTPHEVRRPNLEDLTLNDPTKV